jgi:hypothetical protein
MNEQLRKMAEQAEEPSLVDIAFQEFEDRLHGHRKWSGISQNRKVAFYGAVEAALEAQKQEFLDSHDWLGEDQ